MVRVAFLFVRLERSCTWYNVQGVLTSFQMLSQRVFPSEPVVKGSASNHTSSMNTNVFPQPSVLQPYVLPPWVFDL